MFRSILLLALASIVPPLSAIAAESEWVSNQGANVRLISPGMALSDGQVIEAGVEIELNPGWKTYWRYPGEVGIPTTIDFSNSENVKAITLSYPIPERDDEAFGISLVYKHSLIIPMKIEAINDQRPVHLSGTMSYGICSDICLPAKAELDLTLRPSDPTDRQIKKDLAWFSSLSAAHVSEESQTHIQSAKLAKPDDKPEILVTIAHETDTRIQDLIAETSGNLFTPLPQFVESGNGWSRFKIYFNATDQQSEIARAPYRFTIISSKGAFEQTLHLDVK